MSWRYLNPGLVSLLDSRYEATQYTGYEYSNTGYAFATNNDSNFVIAPLPEISEAAEIWGHLDFFTLPGTISFSWSFPYASTDSVFHLFFHPNGKTQATIIYEHTLHTSTELVTAEDSFLGIQRNAVNSVAFHIVYGDENTAKAELMFSTGKKYTGTGYAVLFNKNTPYIRINDGDSVEFSNIICSDEEITPDEKQTSLLSASATETTMATMGGGMYIANGIEQTFLQTPDISSLIATYGANSTVTGIQVYGNPAYRTGAGLTHMIGLSKSGNTITEHGTCAVGTAPTGVISDGWRLSGVTLGDIQNMQFGWKATR